MVDRVAMAMLAEAARRHPLHITAKWESQDEPDKDDWRVLARAAVGAMREPSPQMVRAGIDADIPGGRYGEPTFRASTINEADAPVIWQAMIDAALAGDG